MATIKLSGCIVTSISGSVSHLNYMLQGKPFSRHRVHLPAKHRRKQSVSAKARLSGYHGKRLAERPDKILYTQGQYCACNSYLVADHLWNSGLVDHDLWRHAVKKSQFSGYDLWLYEAVGLAKQGLYLPDVPSISGGYSRNNLIPGVRFQPPADCVQTATDIGDQCFTWLIYGPPWRWGGVAFFGVNPALLPGLSILKPQMLKWYWDFDNPLDHIILWNEYHVPPYDVQVQSPKWPEPPNKKVEVIVRTAQGQVITYQAGAPRLLQPMQVESVAYGKYQKLGKWQ